MKYRLRQVQDGDSERSIQCGIRTGMATACPIRCEIVNKLLAASVFHTSRPARSYVRSANLATSFTGFAPIPWRAALMRSELISCDTMQDSVPQNQAISGRFPRVIPNTPSSSLGILTATSAKTALPRPLSRTQNHPKDAAQ